MGNHFHNVLCLSEAKGMDKIMDRVKVLESIQDVVRDVLDDETIILNEEMFITDVDGWDSVVHMTVIATLESEFERQFDIEKIAVAKTVAEIIDMAMEEH